MKYELASKVNAGLPRGLFTYHKPHLSQNLQKCVDIYAGIPQFNLYKSKEQQIYNEL